jgi:23S rRNA-/tRNA-specific pseudouridylate synthase
MVKIKLHTGRKHQIRAHLAELGSPILGDRQYGGKKHELGLMLAAVELALDHPRTGERMTFAVPEASDRVLAAFLAIGGGGTSL